MFNRRLLGGQPDSFRLSLGYQIGFQAAQVEDETSVLDETSTSVDWNDAENVPTVVQRIKDTIRNPELIQETVKIALRVTSSLDLIVNAAEVDQPDVHQPDVLLDLTVQRTRPLLKSIELSRTSNSGSVSPSVLAQLLAACELEHAQRVKCTEGLSHVLEDELLYRWQSLRHLSLSNCGLTTLSPSVGKLTNLRELRISNNKLTKLPNELGSLKDLQVLAADNNLLTSIPMAVKHCAGLREISLENNRLATPILDLSALSNLRALHLYGNPLEFLPELTPCTELRHLSLANVRITSDMTFSQWQVEVASNNYMTRGHKLAPLFSLIFRRSTCQHPLLAGALGRIAEDPANCQLIWHEEGAIQQLILMAMSESDVVVEQACKTLGLLGKHNSAIANEIVNSDVLSACLSLINSTRHSHQLHGLKVIAQLAFASEEASRKLMTPQLLAAVHAVMGGGNDDVKACALEALGNLAFCPENKSMMYAANGIKQRISRLSLSKQGSVKAVVKAAAIRAMAILGENETVRQAVGRAPITGRGLRVLTMDGGGMRGISTVMMLRQIEERTGCRISQLFDLICGTSTGGILATAISVKDFSLDQCDDIYRTLGKQVFSKPVNESKEKESWRESLYRVYKTHQQHVRVAVYGCKHDTVVFEKLLKHFCTMPEDAHCISDFMIDTAVLGGPKCFVVSTLASVTPAVPYVFRNYEYPAGTEELQEELKMCEGSSKHRVWQAVRASSAAPYYLDDFSLGNDRFQDGAATANNPAIIALQECRALWPDLPIDCIVSLGCGGTPPQRREKSMSSYLETGNVLIESACSVERVDQALCTLLPLIPGVQYYRFNPIDIRCNVELDDIDPTNLAMLETATSEYITSQAKRFDTVAQLLLKGRAQESTALAVNTDRLGVRRGVFVVECPRSSSRVGRTHVEEVAEHLLAQPSCAASCRLGASAAGGGNGESSFSGQISDVLEQHSSTVGVVHLALHYERQRGVVSRWTQQLAALADPSEAARDLLQRSGYDESSASLSDVASKNPVWEAAGQVVTFVSHTTQWVDKERVSCVLLQYTTPEEILAPEQVGSVRGSWRQLLVVSSSFLPDSIIQSLLEHGARGVLCARDANIIPSPQDAVLFFRELYQQLMDGSSIPDAMSAASAAVPELQEQYGWYSCHEGRFFMNTMQQNGFHFESRVSRHWSWRPGDGDNVSGSSLVDERRDDAGSTGSFNSMVQMDMQAAELASQVVTV